MSSPSTHRGAKPGLVEELRDILGPNWDPRQGWDRALIADRLALSLCLMRERISIPLARAARTFVRSKGWAAFGYARIEDHARERFGRSGRWVRDLSSLAEITEQFPELHAALTGKDGERPLGRVVALLIGRYACTDPDRVPHDNPSEKGQATIVELIELARSMTVRELREKLKRIVADSALKTPADADSTAGEGARRGSTAPEGEAGSAVEGDGPGSLPVSSSPKEEPAWSSDDEDPPVKIRFAFSRPVMAALEEAHDVHSALCGGPTTLADFVEAMLAESFARAGILCPGGDDRRTRRDEGSREQMFSRVSENWAYLNRLSAATDLLEETEDTLQRVESLCSDAENHAAKPRALTPAGDADAVLRALIALEDEIEVRIGQMLALMGESRAWKPLLFAGLGQYAEERLGMSRSTAEDRMRLARRLQGLPGVKRAYEEGSMSASAASLVGRILGNGDRDDRLENAWIEHASRTTVRRLQDEWRINLRGDPAPEVEMRTDGAWSPTMADDDGRRAVADDEGRSVVAGEDRSPAAAGHGAGGRGGGRQRCPAPLTDATWHRCLLRRPGDAMARLSRIGREALEASSVDHPTLTLTLPFTLADRLISTIKAKAILLDDFARGVREPRTFSIPEGGMEGGRRFNVSYLHDVGTDDAARTTESRVSELEASPIALEIAKTLVDRGKWIGEWVGMFALIEECVRTWDDPRQCPERRADETYERDGWRCAAPGCTSRQNLEDHHIVYRSRGGSDESVNRICLCRFHHKQGEHAGFMRCRGEAPIGVIWTLGDQGIGGRFRCDRRL